MNILKKLTNKNLKLNKKRTIGTIIGIVLSTAMICAVATMVTSFRKTAMVETIDNEGYYHFVLEGIKNDDFETLKYNKDLSKIRPFYVVGTTNLVYDEENDYSFNVEIDSVSKQNLIDLKYRLYDGRYAENNSEIALTKFLMNLNDLKIGDTITFDVDTYNETDDNFTTTSKTYTIVGVIDSYISRGYTTGEKTDNIDLYVTLAKPSSYKKSISEILDIDDWKAFYDGAQDAKQPKYSCYLNTYLLHLEVFSFSSDTTKMLLTIAGIIIAIIMIASIFCIRNSFAISTTEKMKMYGMLSSVGATKKQIRKSVIYEGLIIGCIGIPIGILSGLLGDFILFKVVNYLLKDFINLSEGIIFTPSILACIIAIVLAFLTIFLSSLSSARRASKVSPIENLRSTRDITIKANKLKTPKIIEKMFKTGGVLAAKNLKRSKKKYRTTVISLTVSIFVFIALSYFVGQGFNITDTMYMDYGYDIMIYTNNTLQSLDDTAKMLNSFKGVEKSYVIYSIKDKYFISEDTKNMNDKDVMSYSCKGEDPDDCTPSVYLNTVVLDDATFREYVKKNKLKYNDVKDKVLLYDKDYNTDGEETRTFKYKKNDKMALIDEMTETPYEYVIGALCDEPVYGNETISNPTIVFNKDYFDFDVLLTEIYIDSSDTAATVKDIEDYDKHIQVRNFEEESRAERNIVIVISIFLYGFITLITLIGVTNIFNTITSNMELRSQEFAMLKSVGMTKKEFNRMITLETIFYSSKSLIYGTASGLVACLLLYKAFDPERLNPFVIPYKAILICIVFVFAIVYIIMRYSIKKINKQNMIDTIRKETV